MRPPASCSIRTAAGSWATRRSRRPPFRRRRSASRRANHVPEFLLYRDGRRTNAAQGIPETNLGFGLRNPDIDDATPLSEPLLKPVMTVVFLGANDMVHAFRAGPECAVNGCEQGSEELWGYVPFDQLSKLTDLVGGQKATPHTYIASSSCASPTSSSPTSTAIRTTA